MNWDESFTPLHGVVKYIFFRLYIWPYRAAIKGIWSSALFSFPIICIWVKPNRRISATLTSAKKKKKRNSSDYFFNCHCERNIVAKQRRPRRIGMIYQYEVNKLHIHIYTTVWGLYSLRY